MATLVGKSPEIQKIVKGLLELEHDAVAAYEAAIERCELPENKTQLQSFVADHYQHIAILENAAQGMNIEVSDSPDVKVILTKGKVVLADLFGDKAILMAMKTNEDDTVTAYKRAATHENSPTDLQEFFAKAYADEIRHRSWMETAAKQDKKAA